MENSKYFTYEEEEFINLLIEIGTKKNIAKVLVFLAKTPEATLRSIEKSTDLRQPEVSFAMRYLLDRGWIKSREISSERRLRPVKNYALVKPIHEIIDRIENEKMIETTDKLALVQKLQEYIRCSYLKLALSLAPVHLLFYTIFSSEEMSLLVAF
jgi:predicted transcriptional regulator